MNYGFAGDREISVKILEFLISKNLHPKFLFINEKEGASHTKKLIETSGLEERFIFSSKNLNNENTLNILENCNVDYIFGIHYPFIINKKLLNIPNIGFLNLHPAYLPYNKGWHTPSWAIIENSPYGATLHFMSEELDNGDIIHQKQINIEVEDTANSLYKKVLDLEFEVFKEALPELMSLSPKRIKQKEKGTSHVKNDLGRIRHIDLDKETKPMEIINKIRALTTNNVNESAYFEIEGKKYNIQIQINRNE